MRTLVPAAPVALLLALGCSEAFQPRISTRADTRQWPTHKHQASSDGFEQDNRVQLAFNPHGVMRALAAAAWALLPLQHALADVPAQSGGVDVFAEAMKELSTDFEEVVGDSKGPTRSPTQVAGTGTKGGKEKAASGVAGEQGSKSPLSLDEMLQTKRRSNFEPLTHGL